jgi:hypothetical protein
MIAACLVFLLRLEAFDSFVSQRELARKGMAGCELGRSRGLVLEAFFVGMTWC